MVVPHIVALTTFTNNNNNNNNNKILHRRIGFHKSQQPDQPTHTNKYIPLNTSTNITHNNNDNNGYTTSRLGKELVVNGKELFVGNGKELVSVVSDGFQSPKRHLFPPEKIEGMLTWSTIQSIGAGLRNHGNTCFLNSVIQCLVYSPPLANYSLAKEHSKLCRAAGFCVMCILERHVNKACVGGSRSISPTEFIANLRRFAPTFRMGRQEDAHECLRFIVESAQKACMQPYERDKSIGPREAQTTLIGNLFGGYLQSQVKCHECQYESNTYDPYMDLSLDVFNVDSLTGAFSKFVKPEILDSRNMYLCPKCKRRVRAQKQMRIYQAPPLLTVQLKRFNFARMHGGKINKPIRFEQNLTLDSYMTSKNLGSTTNSGHYFSFVRGSNNMWYRMDDDSVSQVPLAAVLQQQAYILFYVRSKSYKSPPSLNETPAQTVLQTLPDQIYGNSVGKKRKDSAFIDSEFVTHSKKLKVEDLVPGSFQARSGGGMLGVGKVSSANLHNSAFTKINGNGSVNDKITRNVKADRKTSKSEFLKKLTEVRDKDNLYDLKVRQWCDAGVAKEMSSRISLMPSNPAIKEPDKWNLEYDRGKTKKKKSKKNPFADLTHNPFQNKLKQPTNGGHNHKPFKDKWKQQSNSGYKHKKSFLR